MRPLAKISITITTLILLTFGVSGISMVRCNCSGKVSLVLPLDSTCCPSEGSCMTVTTVELSDSDLPTHLEAPQLPPAMMESSGWLPVEFTETLRYSALRTISGYSPPRFSLTTVLRV